MHGWSRAQDVGGLPHQFGTLNFGACGNDFRLSDTLALGSHGERVLELGAEDDVLDEHRLNLDTPTRCDIFDYFTNGLCDLFTALDDILENAGTNDVAQSGLGTLNEGLTNVADAEGGFVWRGDVVVDDGGELKVDVVLGHADLLWHLCRQHQQAISNCRFRRVTYQRSESSRRPG